jgi:hypothetical protein
MKWIQPIVEGQGEVDAFPVLLRRLIAEANVYYEVDVGKPIRRKQSQFRNREDIEKAVKLARFQKACDAIAILFDGEDDCPREIAEKVRRWAQAAAGHTPCEVVVAYREYETWFLASIDSLRGRFGIRDDAAVPILPESKRDAKDALEDYMTPRNRAYSETRDQPGMSSVFDMSLAYKNNRSFRKLVTSFGSLIEAMGTVVPHWPPPSWG